MESNRILQILPLTEEASAFYRNHGTFHAGDSGLDLFVQRKMTIKAGETAFIPLGIKVAAYNERKENVSFLIMPRSSIAKTPLRVSNSLGLIDAGYRGELMVCVDNIRTVDYEVNPGDRLVQAVFFDGAPFSFNLVTSLTETSRGERGWGSTSEKQKAADSTVETAEKGKENITEGVEHTYSNSDKCKASATAEDVLEDPNDITKRRKLGLETTC